MGNKILSPGGQSPSRIIVPLDFPDAERALAFAARLDPKLCRVKIGKELFVAAGPAVVQRVQERGFEVFLDLKFHDIPNTVAGACRSAARLGVWMLNVHASGGEAMLRAAREAIAASSHRPRLIAVTILTSLADADLGRVGLTGTVIDNVERLAQLARDCGLDGVVCSAQEAPVIRRNTPGEAVRLGADYLVIGRAITSSPDPIATLESIRRALEEGATA